MHKRIADLVSQMRDEQKEEDGVITIKFRDAISAQACILVSHGRVVKPRRQKSQLTGIFTFDCR